MKAHSWFHPARSHGFTMIETLVALLVLSIGLLGVAALQVSSLRANNSASDRSQATFLAYDIVDRMRANRKEALNGLYNIAYGEKTAPSPATRAEKDLAEWVTRVSASLPGSAQAQIAPITAGGSVFAVRIRWNDSHGDLLKDKTGVMTFEIRTAI